ncbi:MAG: hypothetical protein ACHQ50_07725 [Fimbriimonadales bacterium]
MKQNANWLTIWSVVLAVVLTGYAVWGFAYRPTVLTAAWGLIPVALLLTATFGSGKVRLVAAWVFFSLAALLASSDVLGFLLALTTDRYRHVLLTNGATSLAVYGPATYLAYALLKRDLVSWPASRIVRVVSAVLVLSCVVLQVGLMIFLRPSRAPSGIQRPSPTSRQSSRLVLGL